MKLACLYFFMIFTPRNVILTTASKCISGQHCTYCDDSTGHCTTGCQTGFYGPKCNIRCSRGCKYNLCNSHEGGTEKCTVGCKPGFYGTRCSVPCDQNEGCLKCPQECVNGFCQLGAICVSGCEDSYHGTNCTGCGSDCGVCDRRTGICLEKESSYHTDSLCNPGFYGPNCNLKCSPGCKNGICRVGGDGTAPCTEGCEPGWYGSLCKIPCQTPGDFCMECPRECEDGFCQLGSRCVSGCLDSYYGTGCFSCEPDCQVCNKHTGRCYNCTDGCPFSSCPVQDQCQDRWQTTESLPIADKTDKACDPGFNESNCNLKCSPGCKNGTCRLDDDGTAPCTEGCEPGWYGSLCKITCQTPGDFCMECPSECEDSFCQLGSRCVSGCVDSYYGTGCFTCGPECQVCNKHTGRCYNCTDGCPFSSCPIQDQCQDRWQTTLSLPAANKTGVVSRDTKLSVFHWVLLTAGAGISVFVVVSLVVLIKLMKKRKQSASSEYCQTFRLDETVDYTELRSDQFGRYIQAVTDPNNGLCEEEYV